MEGLNQHLEFQIKLAGGKTGGQNSRGSSLHDRLGPTGVVPDDVPDIAALVPVEKVD